jgi:hypothetical protein
MKFRLRMIAMRAGLFGGRQKLLTIFTRMWLHSRAARFAVPNYRGVTRVRVLWRPADEAASFSLCDIVRKKLPTALIEERYKSCVLDVRR